MGRPGLTVHRKFRRLSRALGSAITARGVLELLWEPCYEAGDDYIGTAEDIDTLVGWTGESGALARALVDAGAPEGHGFIEVVTDQKGQAPATYRIHDLWHHAPEYVKNRAARERERTTPKRCGRCAGTYHSSDNRSVYCSDACRSASCRARRKDETAVQPEGSGTSRSATDRHGAARNVTVKGTDRHGTPAPAPAPAPVDQDQDQDPQAPARDAFTEFSQVRRHLLAAAHIAIDLEPDIEDGALAEAIKTAAGRMKVQGYAGRDITVIIDAVRGERQRRRA
jgi:hypothetical protein